MRHLPILCMFFTVLSLPCRADLRISEFLTSNSNGLTDADGDTSDWIEIENTDTVNAADLTGWHLTDDAADLNKWTFSVATSVPAGGRLIVFASAKDPAGPVGELHTNFSLNAKGEYLALVEPDGVTIATEYSPKYPDQKSDVSFGIGRDAQSTTLTHPQSAARFFAPADGSLGLTWTGAGFADASWAAVSAGIGYQIETGGGQAGAPIAYWNFENTLADQSGNGNTGSAVGSGYLAAKPTQVSGSYSADFDASAYVSVPINVSETAYTASMWVRTTANSGGILCVVDQELGQGGHDRHVYLSGGNVFARTWNDETIQTSGLSVNDGNWHHIAHVFGGAVGGQRIYVDGVLRANGGKAFSDFDWQQRIHIGFSNDAANNYLDGQIDDVAIWSEALGAAQIQALANGASPQALAGFEPIIESDVEAAMHNQRDGAYLRVPFDAPNLAEFDELELRVRYDDGFVAYLNGIEVARRNVPSSVSWDSVSLTNRPTEDAISAERIDLTAHLALLNATGNVLAVHALNNDANSSNFLMLPELLAFAVDEETNRFFQEPTPGEKNPSGVIDFVADTKFLPGRGYYNAAFNVTINCATTGATIVHTTNGTKPTLTNGTKTLPIDPDTAPSAVIPISTTTNLRAAAFKTGYEPTDIDTHTYIFAAQVATQSNSQPGLPTSWGEIAADYGVDPNVVNTTLPGYSFEDALLSIPTMSITSEPGAFFDPSSGIYYNSGGRGLAWEREVSVEYFNPDGSNDFQVGAGARLHGNSSRGHGFTPKHPIRLNFRERYGAKKLKYNLFPGGHNEFDLLVLRGASTDSFPVVDGAPRWINDKGTYMRDQHMRDLLWDLGNVSCRGTYVHLYINGLYWGLYNPSERPIDNFNAKFHGGEKEEWDVVKDFAELQAGNMTAWNAMMAAAGAGLSSNTAFQRFLGNNPDGSRNPAYDVHIHLPSFVDYMIAHITGAAEDWPDHNYWAARRRGAESDGWHFYAWDQEISYDTVTRPRSHIFPAQPYESVNVGGSPAFVYDRLRQNATFKQLFRDRVHALFFNDGAMTPENMRARWGKRASEINKAIVAESARWGDAREEPPIKRETKWMTEQNYMQNPGGFWDLNHIVALQRFRNVDLYPATDAPGFSLFGGSVPVGYELVFDSPHSVYYTTDGSDPLDSPTAEIWNGSQAPLTMIEKKATWKFLDNGSDQGTGWKISSFDDSGWASGGAEFGFGDGGEVTSVDPGPSPVARHITYYFRHGFDVANAGAVIDLKLRVLRDDGAVAYLNGVEIARSNMHPTNPVTFLTTALSNVTGADESTFYFEFSVDPALLVNGENVLAIEVHQVSAQSGDMSFDAELAATVVSSPQPVILSRSGTVRARALNGGDWSGLNEAYFIVGEDAASDQNLVVSQLYYHPKNPTLAEQTAGFVNDGDFEFIELMNIGASDVNLSGVEFGTGVDFDFAGAAVTSLPPGGRVLVVSNQAAFEMRYGSGLPVAGEFQNGTGLSNGGEQIVLLDGDHSVIRDFTYDDVSPWPVAADTAGFSLVLVNPASNPDHALAASWRASIDPGGTAAGFTDWQSRWFDPDVPDYAQISAGGSDGDLDGNSNLIEYFGGGIPLVADAGPITDLAIDGAGDLLLTFRHRSELAGVVWDIESSSGVTDWVSAAATWERSTLLGDGRTDSVWRIAAPVSGDRLFVRLSVSIPE
jgi:hypothetical protein